LRLAEHLNVGIGMWRLQNLFWELLSEAGERTEGPQALMDELGDKLNFSVAVARFGSDIPRS
jgi:hypothetical protein